MGTIEDEDNSELLETTETNDTAFDDVQHLLKVARIDVANVITPVLLLKKTPETGPQDEHCLLEVPSKMAETVNAGHALVIKGSVDSAECVLCTEDKTHEVLKAEVSNSLCLTPKFFSVKEGNVDIQPISNIIHSYYELKPMRPHIDLFGLLKSTAYQGPDIQDAIPNSELYTLSRLYESILASNAEIDDEIKNLGVVEIDGYMRLLDDNYLYSIVADLSEMLDDRSIVPIDDIMRTLTAQNHAESIIAHVLCQYGCVADDKWTPDETKLCQFYAELLLKSTNKFNLSDFLEAWKQSVPKGLVPTLDHIKGMAYVVESDPAVICYLPAASLSYDVKERLNALFDVKSTWTIDEMTPYLSPLECGKSTVSVMLMKYARSYTKNGKKFYTSKYRS